MKIILPKIKNKERILEATREKDTDKGVLIRLSADFSKKPCRQEGAGKKYSMS